MKLYYTKRSEKAKKMRICKKKIPLYNTANFIILIYGYSFYNFIYPFSFYHPCGYDSSKGIWTLYCSWNWWLWKIWTSWWWARITSYYYRAYYAFCINCCYCILYCIRLRYSPNLLPHVWIRETKDHHYTIKYTLSTH